MKNKLKNYSWLVMLVGFVVVSLVVVIPMEIGRGLIGKIRSVTNKPARKP